MRLKFYFIIILIFFSCNRKENEDTIIGEWHYSKDLFLKEQKMFESPKFDLSDIFKKIIMIFENTDFTSYLDDQITRGQWKIENDSLYMFLDKHGWNTYFYKHIDNTLIIHDRDFIITLERKSR
tara:strand:+ start:190 stop:561 length:372 start_codon:yes stop_codon:yes gene_type:complete